MNHPLKATTGLTRGAVAGVLAMGLCAGGESLDRSAIHLSDNLFDAPAGTIALSWSPAKRIRSAVRNVVKTLTDQIENTVGSVTTITNDVGQVLGKTVTISSKISPTVSSAFKTAFDRRPEWFLDPPPWLEFVTRSCVGVSFDQLNTGTNLILAISDGQWSDADKALLVNAAIHEGVVATSQAVQGLVTNATAPVPVVGIVINAGIAYGFDKAEDRLTDRVSQHYKSDTSPGVVASDALLTQNKPIALTFTDGVILPSITVANVIVLGGATNGNMTIVTTNATDGKASYYTAADGGSIIIKPNTVLVGTLVLNVGNSTGLPDEVKARGRELLSQTAATTEWVDNVAIPTPANSPNG